ncbi:hypothetical protein P9112_003092 [Eukaryota sp. TZLM1-RC]
MDNVLQTTTVGASVNQFFDSEPQEAMERQFQVLASIGAHATHLARLFVLQYPEHSMWLTQSQFWSLCFDFVCQSEPKQRRPFENQPLVYQALQHLVQHCWPWRPLNETTSADGGRFWCPSTVLGSRAIQLREAFCQLLADGPVVWKRNFFKSCAQFLNCPWPKKYADCVLQGIPPDESILQWYQEIHQHILVHWLNMTANAYIGGGQNLFENSIRNERFPINMESAATIVQPGLNILSFLEDNCPDVMKRHSLSPLSSWSRCFCSLTKEAEAYFTKLNANKELLNNPYRFFNKSKFINYTIFSNGDSLRFTFTQKERKTYNRPNKAEFEPRRASGNYDFHNSERKRKSNVHRTANPQRRPRLPVEQQPNYRDPDENFNLCGWTAGSFRNSATVFERSGLLLNPKERRLNHPPPLTQATPNTYSAQSFQEYLIEISLPYVPESEEEPEYASIMSGNLQRGARKKLRRNKFDFFIRRQKRLTTFINKIKRLSEGRNTIVWFGNGGGGPSRQSVKSPRKRFLKQIKKHFGSVKVGDEFMTSAKVNCCKVFHRKIYHDGGRVNNAKFDCPRCQTNWSRDISASRNQLEIAISEYFTGTRPEPFRRPRRVRRLRRQQ